MKNKMVENKKHIENSGREETNERKSTKQTENQESGEKPEKNWFSELKKSVEQTESTLTKKEYVLFVGISLLMIHLIALVVRYLYCLWYLDRQIISSNPLYIFIAIFAPIALWLYATTSNFFVYHNRKIALLILSAVNAILTIGQPFYALAWRVLVYNIFKIETNAAMTEIMVLNLARMAMALAMGLLFFVFYRLIFPIFEKEETLRKLKAFKLSHHIDIRQNKEDRYDLKITRLLKNGNIFPIYEIDRFLHILMIGTTGTGKTSSVYLPQVANDIMIKVKNRVKRHKALAKMILSGRAKLSEKFKHGMEFKEKYIIPVDEDAKKEMENICTRYPDCGMTLIAPNSGHIEKTLKIAKAHGGVKVNVIDPSMTYADKYDNAKDVGINPFYIPQGLNEEDKAVLIKNKGQAFSEVIQAVNERNGKSGDMYFVDINLSVTSNVAIVVMLYKSIIGEQAYIFDIQNAITNFITLKPYVSAIEKFYDIDVEVVDMQAETKPKNGPLTMSKYENVIKSGEEGRKEQKRNNAESEERRRIATHNPYYQMILFVKTELLGPGAKDMVPQSRGIRNIINKFLLNPRYLKMLSAKEEDMLNFDEIFSENQITVINTGIEYGASSSTGFGLFFLLLFDLAVKQRPGTEDTRTPHFLSIDEATQYMNPIYEDMGMLYRQYRVSVLWAVQSLAQFEKTPATAYIGRIMQTLGTQIIFGRASAAEMKLYSELAGVEDVEISQKTVSGGSMLDDETKIGFSERITPDRINTIEGSDIRFRDFQEATVFTTRNGRVLKGEICKYEFVPKYKMEEGYYEPDEVMWHMFLPEEETPIEVEKDDIATTAAMKQIIENTKEKVSMSINDKERIGTKEEERIEQVQNELYNLFHQNPASDITDEEEIGETEELPEDEYFLFEDIAQEEEEEED